MSDIPDTPDPLVLQYRERRVELHLRRDDDDIATLLAYAGSGPQPDKSSLQGPYQRLEQAIGARRAVARQLQNQGYEYLSDEHPMWSLRAQRDINAMRHIKSDSAVDYRFDPKDVFLDW
ncbi:hypothetical protein [Gilvimarinus xylanilyticus]|uniref:Uncharacterized protein n=1 Tax=Gilvimarinus xylanilyticus TaxID=2944139 RepID=A0A9X2HZC3_9GAMM|nr:hypothetical protein [Gilvimarinus xylanilyticus]MCP8899296.1 hypothetical protein [Gilvimarinus xylanilyticus]